MGTRGLMGVRVDGQDKLTYCHFDSYPTGWPQEMVKDIKVMLVSHGIERMRELARATKQVDGSKSPSTEELAAFGVSSKLWSQVSNGSDWYSHLRGLHGKFKETLNLGVMLESNDFIEDSLFCEWAYIANLDDMTFEVYAGFQKKPHTKGRFAGHPKQDYSGTDYYPCALVATYPLDAIPKDWVEQVEAMEEADA